MTDCTAWAKARAHLEDTVVPGMPSPRQARMVLAEIERAVDGQHVATTRCACRSAADLFTPANVSGYLEAADAGELSVKRVKRDSNTSRVRRTVLRRFLSALGLTVAVPGSPYPEPPGEPTEAQLRALWRLVASTSTSNSPAVRHAHVRRAAIVAVAVAAGTRPGELRALAVDDVDDGPGGMTLTIRRPAADEDQDVVVPLSEQARRAVQRWLDVRRDVTGPLGGADTGRLFVTVQVSARAVYRPAGLPVSLPAIEASVRSAVREVNGQQQGVLGWAPMVPTLDWLRQAARSPKGDCELEASLVAPTRKETLHDGDLALVQWRPAGPRLPGQLDLFGGEVAL
ncbi:tyrosine-type recombinase/integrase [Streptomyces sp. NPDC059810]|uniref:tyrosine-type recombinase/integrase n=1 Tax=Streptomyces sp. NPDC059810 TaxID=3346956 RepID=UPI0036580D39